MSSTHKVEIVEIKEVKEHPNTEATRLEIVPVYGWNCVVRKGDFKVGDLAAFIQPESVVKTTRSEFSFLHKEGKDTHRIGVVRLKGVYSPGLLIPAPPTSQIGDDVADLLEVTHYEPPVQSKAGGESIKGPEGLFIPKYDVDSWYRYRDLFKEEEPIAITEKIHGCLEKNTEITMYDGYVLPISQVQPGHRVLSYSSGSFQSALVEAVKIQEPALRWMELDLENGKTLTCTEDHRILTTQGWIEARDLTEEYDIISV